MFHLLLMKSEFSSAGLRELRQYVRFGYCRELSKPLLSSSIATHQCQSQLQAIPPLPSKKTELRQQWNALQNHTQGEKMKSGFRHFVACICFLSVSFGATGCGGGTNDNIACTQNAAAGMNVSIFDARTGAALAATASLTDGTYQETSTQDQTTFSGAYERPGTYTVRVSKSGYAPFEQTGFVVTKGVCHVNPVSIRVDLQPLQ